LDGFALQFEEQGTAGTRAGVVAAVEQEKLSSNRGKRSRGNSNNSVVFAHAGLGHRTWKTQPALDAIDQ
jgi:hypothetical protein